MNPHFKTAFQRRIKLFLAFFLNVATHIFISFHILFSYLYVCSNFRVRDNANPADCFLLGLNVITVDSVSVALE